MDRNYLIIVEVIKNRLYKVSNFMKKTDIIVPVLQI